MSSSPNDLAPCANKHRSGNHTCNLEHRRVNFSKVVDRELKVDTKRSLNLQLSSNNSRFSKNYSRSSTPNSLFSRSRIRSWAALASSEVSVRFLSKYVNE